MQEKNKLVVFQDAKNSKNSGVPKTFCVFEHKKIRRIWHNDEWYFSIVDIIGVLTESENPQIYWRVLKKRLKDEGNETVTNCNALKLSAPDGKMRLTDVGNTKEIFRLIQSIPSPRAEPFKQWLAQVGYERIEEIENPEIGQDRIKCHLVLVAILGKALLTYSKILLFLTITTI